MVEQLIKEWYVIIEGHVKGPLTINELRKEWKITPDTLVWKEGFGEWLPIRLIPELKILFEDPPAKKPTPPIEPPAKKPLAQNEVLTVHFPPPYLITGLIVVILLLLYFLLMGK